MLRLHDDLRDRGPDVVLHLLARNAQSAIPVFPKFVGLLHHHCSAVAPKALERKSASALKDFIVWMAPATVVEHFVEEGHQKNSTDMSHLFSEGSLHHVEKSSSDNAKFVLFPSMAFGKKGDELVMLAIAEIRFGAWAARLQEPGRAKMREGKRGDQT